MTQVQHDPSFSRDDNGGDFTTEGFRRCIAVPVILIFFSRYRRLVVVKKVVIPWESNLKSKFESAQPSFPSPVCPIAMGETQLRIVRRLP